MHDIVITALPIDIVIGDKRANMKAAQEALKKVPALTDIAVLPELFSTGFISDPKEALKAAEGADSPTLKELKKWARQINKAIAGSMLYASDSPNGKSLRNRAFFIEPTGETTFYDKRHLFVLSDESKILQCGTNKIPIVRFRGWNIAIAVCYDTRFPVWMRNVENKYDVMLIPANWPAKRGFAWEHLLQARAIENQAYYVGANRCGSDEYGDYDNTTFIYDYMGQSKGQKSEGNAVTATLSKDLLEEIRDKFPVWADADKFIIDLSAPDQFE